MLIFHHHRQRQSCSSLSRASPAPKYICTLPLSSQQSNAQERPIFEDDSVATSTSAQAPRASCADWGGREDVSERMEQASFIHGARVQSMGNHDAGCSFAPSSEWAPASLVSERAIIAHPRPTTKLFLAAVPLSTLFLFPTCNSSPVATS